VMKADFEEGKLHRLQKTARRAGSLLKKSKRLLILF